VDLITALMSRAGLAWALLLAVVLCKFALRCYDVLAPLGTELQRQLGRAAPG